MKRLHALTIMLALLTLSMPGQTAPREKSPPGLEFTMPVIPCVECYGIRHGFEIADATIINVNANVSDIDAAALASTPVSVKLDVPHALLYRWKPVANHFGFANSTKNISIIFPIHVHVHVNRS